MKYPTNMSNLCPVKAYKQLMCHGLILIFVLTTGCNSSDSYDILITNAILIDGTGGTSYAGSLGINGDTIAGIGDLKSAKGILEIDAAGKVVAPGFINMLSWANESLIEDGRSQGDIRQGVTLEVMGEGHSMGPLTDKMKAEMKEGQQDIQFDIAWTTLGDYLEYLEKKGVAPNIASFVGNGTLREYVMGYENREPSQDELSKMKSLTRQAMKEGAIGLSTSLIYVPSGHAKTDEIVSLAQEVASLDGLYISHIRDEEEHLLDAVDELISIAEKAQIRSEIYHFKASGTANWNLLDLAIDRLNSAREKGLAITTDMYMYNASSTGLNILLPEWAKEGGHKQTMTLMTQPSKKKKMIDEIKFHVPPDKILLVGFRNKELKGLIGKTLAQVAVERGKTPAETVVDLIREDDSRIQVVYFSMSEDNINKKLALPYMSICSDAGSYTNEGVFLKQSTHPRAYGSFARLLGHYVREEKVISLEEAVYKLTSLPASNMKIRNRGALKKGYFADVVIFDPHTIRDNATFEDPHQYATGVEHVFVNGVQVLTKGEVTGNLPGRVVRGPGWTGW